MNLLQSFRLLILLIAFLIPLASCDEKKSSRNKSNSGRVEPGAQIATGIPEPGTETGDTIFLSNQYVLFYLPSASEQQDLITSASFKDLDQMISEFEKTTGNIRDSLLKTGNLKYGFTEKRFFKIYMRSGESMIMNKLYLKQPVGMVMTDGLQPPVTRYGVLSASEYHKALKEFFFR